MHMRHQARFSAKADQFLVRLDQVDGREAQALELGYELADARTRLPSFGLPGRSLPHSGDVDAGQHDLAIAIGDEAAHLLDRIARRYRA